MVERIGSAQLLLISAALLELASRCTARLVRQPRQGATYAEPDAAIGGGAFSGIKVVFASPYLLAIAGYTILASMAGTYGYNLQARLVEAAAMTAPARTAFFARLDLMVSVLSVVTQTLLVGPLLTRFGAGFVLALIPPLSTLSFATLVARPVLPVAADLQVLRRTVAYGLWGPANNVLFTVVDREQKYKAKAFIDTVVYRGGDVLTSASVAGVLALGVGVRGAAAVALPLGLLWFVVALVVGRLHRQIAEPAQKLR